MSSLARIPAWVRRVLTINATVVLVVLVLALLAPSFVNQFTLIRAFITANVFAMFAASWDILSGFTGQENFGHAAFIGSAGFTAGLLTRYADLPMELNLVVAAVIAGTLGLVIGVPALRLRGPYLALATLAAAAALLRLAFVFKRYTGGEEGIAGLERLRDTAVLGPIGRGIARIFVPGFDGLRGIDQTTYVNYYVILIAAVIMITGLTILGSSRRGLVLRSIQQDEDSAEAAGVPTARYKVAAFVLSSSMAGVAGVLWVHTLSTVNIDTLTINLSLLIIVMAMIGGAGSIVGPAAGAYLIIITQDYILDQVGISEGSQVKPMLFSALLIAVMIWQPRGLFAPLFRRLSGRRLFPERQHG